MSSCRSKGCYQVTWCSVTGYAHREKTNDFPSQEVIRKFLKTNGFISSIEEGGVVVYFDEKANQKKLGKNPYDERFNGNCVSVFPSGNIPKK